MIAQPTSRSTLRGQKFARDNSFRCRYSQAIFQLGEDSINCSNKAIFGENR